MARGVERFPVSVPRGPRPRRRRLSTATNRPASRRTRHADEYTATPTTTISTTSTTATITSKQRTASKLYNLEMDVVELAREIEQLRLHRSLLHTRALFTQRDLDGSAVQKTQQYFHVFRHGLHADDPTPPAYVASIADEDLQLGLTQFKRAMLLEQWRRYTQYFAIRKYEIDSVRVIATECDATACIVRGEGVFHGTFTYQALELAFPNVLLDPWLTQELVGCALVTPVAFVLHFDAEGRVVRHDGEVDWFKALAQTLGDYQRAAAIMKGAVVAEEGMLNAPDEDLREKPRIDFDEEEKADSWRRNARLIWEPDDDPDDDDPDDDDPDDDDPDDDEISGYPVIV